MGIKLIWEAYGWGLLVMHVLGLGLSYKPRKVRSTDARVVIGFIAFAIYFPVIGHLIGWW